MKTSKKIITGFIKLVICLLLVIITVYPCWHVIMYSFSDSREAMGGGLFVLPRGFSLTCWEIILGTSQIFKSLGVSISKTVIGTLISIVLSALTAYPLALRYFKGRTLLQGAIFFTMLFSGGTIPTYILLKDLHLLNTFWVYVIPGAINAYNMFILRNFFQSIPDSLSESAMLDGAGHMQIFLKIFIPLSKAALATQAMFYGVANWNSYMDGVLYVNDNSLMLMQVYLRQLIMSTGAKGAALTTAGNMSGLSAITEESMKMTVIALTVIPIIVFYLSLQKYFIKGTMVGSIKG